MGTIVGRTISQTKKGGIFTIDMLLALLVAGVILVASFALIGGKEQLTKDAAVLAQDSLLVLESSKALANAVETNSNAQILQFLDALPSNICGNISVYSSPGLQILSGNKQGCDSSDAVDLARNAFILNFNVYYAEMQVWYKQNE